MNPSFSVFLLRLFDLGLGKASAFRLEEAENYLFKDCLFIFTGRTKSC
jgi:hypothetical protein